MPSCVNLLVASQEILCQEVMQPASKWLSKDELNRWLNIKSDLRKREFLACRIGLRKVLALSNVNLLDGLNLSAAMGSAPRLLTKEKLPEQAMLSLSHSQDYVACACASTALGVDLEILPSKRLRNIRALVNFCCSSYELHMLSASVDEAHMFTKIWVLKESWFKCLGTGIDLQQMSRVVCCRSVDVPADACILGYALLWEFIDCQSRHLIFGLSTLEQISFSDVKVDIDNSFELVTAESWVFFECNVCASVA